MRSDDRRSDAPEGVEALEDLLSPSGEPPTQPALPAASSTRPIPRGPQASEEDTAPQPVVRAAPVPPSGPAHPPPPAAQRPSLTPTGGSGPSPFALVAMLVAAVLVGALIMGLFQIMGSAEPAAAPTTTTVTRTPEPTTTDEPSPAPRTPSPSKSSRASTTTSSAVKRTGDKPAAVKRVCAGSWKGARVGVGTTSTTCGFAEQVRKAYVNGGGDGSKTSIRAKSPATGKTYTMSCSGATVTRCTGGRNAVVYLY